MRKPLHKSFVLFFLFLSLTSLGQNVDSLRQLLETAETDAERVQLYIYLANATVRLDKQQSMGYAKKAEALAEAIEDIPLLAKSCTVVGRIYHINAQYDSAALCYHNALRIAEDDRVRATLYNNLGALHRRLGDYDKAQENYISSMELSEALGDTASLGRVYFNLGILNASVGKYEEALAFYQKNHGLALASGDSLWQSNASRGLGDVYWFLKKYGLSRMAYSEALQYLPTGLDNNLESILIGIGNCQAIEGNFAEAEKMYLESIAISRKQNDLPSLAQGLVNLGSVRDSLGQDYKAIDSYREALEISEGLGLLSTASAANGGLSAVHAELGNYALAYRYGERYHELKDSLLSAENLQQVSELQLKYDTEKANLEITRLEADNAIQEVNLQRQKTKYNRLALGTVALLFLAAFGYAYYRYWRQKKDLAVEKAHLAEVEKVLAASRMFVPERFLQGIDRQEVVSVMLGDQKARMGTVLFSDIRGFTTFAENMSPKETFDFLNAYLGRMGPIITAHRGFVNQFAGDGIMAIFLETVDDALRAAVAMQLTLQAYNLRREMKDRTPVEIGIGLHTGEMMLGVIGYGERFDTGIISDTVNTSSRIEGLTKFFGGQIIFTEATFQRLEKPQDFNLRHIGKVQVKGRQAAMKIYECFDGDPLPQLEQKQATQKLFAEGIKKYYQKDFPEAASLFHQVVAQNEADRVATFLLQNSVRLSAEGVPVDWVGEVRMGEK